MKPRTPKEWIARAAVARELEIHASTVDAVAAAGRIRIRQLPGGLPPRYSASDVARVKTEAVSLADMTQGAA